MGVGDDDLSNLGKTTSQAAKEKEGGGGTSDGQNGKVDDTRTTKSDEVMTGEEAEKHVPLAPISTERVVRPETAGETVSSRGGGERRTGTTSEEARMNQNNAHTMDGKVRITDPHARSGRNDSNARSTDARILHTSSSRTARATRSPTERSLPVRSAIQRNNVHLDAAASRLDVLPGEDQDPRVEGWQVTAKGEKIPSVAPMTSESRSRSETLAARPPAPLGSGSQGPRTNITDSSKSIPPSEAVDTNARRHETEKTKKPTGPTPAPASESERNTGEYETHPRDSVGHPSPNALSHSYAHHHHQRSERHDGHRRRQPRGPRRDQGRDQRQGDHSQAEPSGPATMAATSSSTLVRTESQLRAPSKQVLPVAGSLSDDLSHQSNVPAHIDGTRSLASSTLSRCFADLAKDHQVVVVAGAEGKLSMLNELAVRRHARALIHTGNFGFFDKESVAGLSLAYLRSTLARRGEVIPIPPGADEEQLLRSVVSNKMLLSELPLFISGERRFEVPLYVIWGQHEDVTVIEKFRRGVYHIPNLYIIDHRASYAISTEQVTLRLFGLGGTLNYHRLFDVGHGSDAVSGGDGSAWANLVQMGELLDLADRYGPLNQEQGDAEVRLFLCQNNPSREPLAHLLANELRADLTISYQGEGTHFCSLFEDATVHSSASLCAFLRPCKEDLKSLWDQVYFACADRFTEHQQRAAKRIIGAISRPGTELVSPKSLMQIILPPYSHGQIVLQLSDNGSVSLQMHSTDVISRRRIQKTGIGIGASGTSKLSSEATPFAPTVTDQQVPSPPTGVIEIPSTLAASTETMPANPSSSITPSKANPSSDFKFPSATSSMPAFYEDRRPARTSGRGTVPRSFPRELYVSNLPGNITGRQLDEQMLASYDIQEIAFSHRRPDVALVRFSSEREAERALSQLQQVSLQGHQLRISRKDPDDQVNDGL